MSERRTNKMCPECDEDYLVEVREPGVPEPIEVYCPSCGYTVEPEEKSEEGEEGQEEDLEEGDLEGIEVDEEDHEY